MGSRRPHVVSNHQPCHRPTLERLEGRRLLHAGHAVAHLISAPGMEIHGNVQLKQVEGGVEIRANVHGLAPGAHGFHVHAGLVCNPNDPGGPFQSAGGHFNPNSNQHGYPTHPDHHAGDLGNLVADNKGKAKARFVVNDVTLDGANSFANRALIIHANPDDGHTQPTGNSGARVCCGIIDLAGDSEGARPTPTEPPPAAPVAVARDAATTHFSARNIGADLNEDELLALVV